MSQSEGKTDFQKWCRSIKPKAYIYQRPARPQNDFTPRATRRNTVRGVVPGWRTVWYATRGWPQLVALFAERVAQKKAAQA